jgi:hypothetical protein
MIKLEEQEVDTGRTQKKQGYFEIRKLKLIKLNASEIIGADIRTSEGDDRIELSRKNQTGFPTEGLYLYANGKIVTTLWQNTLTFYDNDGNQVGIIQMPTAGNLGINSDNVTIMAQDGNMSLFASDDMAIEAQRIFLPGIPTSPSGLPTGAIYSDSGTLKIVT